MRIIATLCNCWKIIGGFFLLAMLVSPSVWAETITLGGVGSMTPLIKRLAAEYTKKNPGIEISIIDPPIGSNGGIRAISAGRIDIALSGRATSSEEAGQTWPWLQTPLVFATQDGKSKGLSSAEIADIFAGRKTTWDDNKPIRLVLRGEHESETKLLRTLSPAVDVAVGEALKRSDRPIAENDLIAVDMLGKIAGSLGTTNLGLLKTTGSRLTILPLNGVVPSVRSVETGKYGLLRYFYLILPNNPGRATLAFANWLSSPAALAVARKLDYLPFR